MQNFLPYVNFADSLSFRSGSADSVLKALCDDERRQAECDIAVLRLEFGAAKMQYLSMPKQHRLYICALNTAGAEALAVGDFDMFDSTFNEIERLRLKHSSEPTIKLTLDISRNLILTAIKVPDNRTPIEQLYSLPIGTRKCSYLSNAYYATVLQNNFETVAYSFEMLLSSLECSEYSPRDIYLYLVCSLAFECIGLLEKANYYAEKALDFALPDRFLLPFADFLSYSQVLSGCLKKRDSKLFNIVHSHSERSYKNYIILHNKFTKSHLTTLLTSKEFGIAKHIGIGATNKEIAAALGCSVATVKRAVEVIFDKLAIEKRGEIKEFLL